MRVSDSTLAKAIVFSLVLHALLFVSGSRPVDRAREGAAVPPAQLDVTLRSRAALAELEPQLLEEAPSRRAARAPEGTHAPRTSPIDADLARPAKIQISRVLLYPAEAIARGLEGEALVLLILDDSGDAIAARLESSSGHLLLDAAAVRAVGTLRGLPDSVPREVLLPVRFRLR